MVQVVVTLFIEAADGSGSGFLTMTILQVLASICIGLEAAVSAVM